jgi:hypothetical protein
MITCSHQLFELRDYKYIETYDLDKTLKLFLRTNKRYQNFFEL